MGGKSPIIAFAGLALLACAGPAAAAAPCKILQLAEIPVTMEGLSPVIEAKINGQPARLIADSGAFFDTLTSADAAKFKLASGSYSGDALVVKGVNGYANANIKVAHDFTVIGHTFKDVDFVTVPQTVDWNVSGFLGQNFLNAVNTEYDLANGVIRLFKLEGCEDTALAYWTAGKPFSMMPIDSVRDGERPTERRETRGKVWVNGVELTALFDTGAERSVLTVHGAAKAGIKQTDANVEPGGLTGGLGRQWEQTWIAPVKSFQIGGEEVRNTHLRLGTIDLDDADMVIGADFFLSHRLFVDNSHRRLYFSYNGGPVVRLDVGAGGPAGGAPAGAAVAAASVTAEPDGAAKDPDAIARRAHASDARHDYAGAIADYTRALAAKPDDAKLYYDRATSYVHNDQRDLAVADLDRAVKLKPDFVDALMTRGAVHLHQHRLELARADFDAAEKLDRTRMTDVGDIYTNDDHFAEAVAELDAWLANLPKGDNGATGYNNRCWARALWNHDVDKALADCNEALKLVPRNFGTLDSRGLTNLRLGRYDDAIRDYDAALSQQPKFAWTLYCRGISKVKAGRTVEGEADKKAAVAIDPSAADKAKHFGLMS